MGGEGLQQQVEDGRIHARELPVRASSAPPMEEDGHVGPLEAGADRGHGTIAPGRPGRIGLRPTRCSPLIHSFTCEDGWHSSVSRRRGNSRWKARLGPGFTLALAGNQLAHPADGLSGHIGDLGDPSDSASSGWRHAVPGRERGTLPHSGTAQVGAFMVWSVTR